MLREKPEWHNLAATHQWTALDKAMSTQLSNTHVDLPSDLPDWFRSAHEHLEDPFKASLADLGLVFHEYTDTNKDGFVTALEQRHWAHAARIAKQHALCHDLTYQQIYHWFAYNGQQKCAAYNIHLPDTARTVPQ